MHVLSTPKKLCYQDGKLNYYVVLFEKTQKSQVQIVHDFCIRLGMLFGIVSGTFGYDFRYLFVLDFRLLFWMYFSWRSAPKLSPNGSPNGPRISKKWKLVLSSSVWEDSTPI